MEEEKKKFILQCARCKVGIETVTEPTAKSTGFLCNSCWMMWKDKEKKMIGHAYADEARAAFIKFINELDTLKIFKR